MYKKFLCHGGPGSGRYPKGSGKNPRGKSGSQASPLSPADKKKMVDEYKTNSEYRKMVYENSKLKKVKDLADESGKIVKEAKRMSDDSIRNGTKKGKLDLSKMTDEELRKHIDRETLERRYNDLFAPDISTVTKGQRSLNNILTYAGGALAVGTSVLSIALMIKQLREKNNP